jgi:hypothetical protein
METVPSHRTIKTRTNTPHVVTVSLLGDNQIKSLDLAAINFLIVTVMQ